MCVRHIIDIKGVPENEKVYFRIFHIDVTLIQCIHEVLQIIGYLFYIYSYCLF